VVPPLADGFSPRSETAAGLISALDLGSVIVLEPAPVGADGSRDWLASCGKTQLAAYLAELLWGSRSVELLIWIVATSRASVLAGYVEAAAAAWGADPADDGESVAARFVGWLAETSRPWLVVLHDVPDMAGLKGLWPKGPAGRVLITTTKFATVSAEYNALVLPVGAFSAREAMHYLMGRLSVDPDLRLGAIDLVKDLDYDPAALSHATAVMATSSISCREYRDFFLRRRGQLAAIFDGEPAAAAVTWTFSFELASRLSPHGAAQSVLAIAALLDGRGIPSAVFTTTAACAYLAEGHLGRMADREAALSGLRILERAGLLALDLAGTPPTAWISPAVQAAVQASMPDGVRERAGLAAAAALLELWPDDEPRQWLTARLRSSAVSLRQATSDLLWADGCHPLLLRAGDSLDSARLVGPAVEYWAGLAAATGQQLGQRHPDTVAAVERLARAYLAAGQAKQAASWFEWVLTDRLRRLGPEHPATIGTRCSLGRALTAADQADDAITALTQAVADYERVCGPDHFETLGARDELAAAHCAARQYPEAIAIGQRTLADRERTQGSHHRDTIAARAMLGGACLGGDRVKDAISYYKRALADSERVLGYDHPDTVATRASLATVYHPRNRRALSH
jgi:tetratricopeptide (TPR) repeat protein